MTDSVFLVGARVMFGVAVDGYPLYGWPRDIDFTQWEYVSGRVVECDDPHMVKVEYLHPESQKRRSWKWPLKGHMGYQEGQWRQPGFLRLEENQTLFQDLVDCQALEQVTVIRSALEATGWNLSKASNLLGFKSVQYLRAFMRSALYNSREPYTRKKEFFRSLWQTYQANKLPPGRPKRTK
jgi:hypothetical protein